MTYRNEAAGPMATRREWIGLAVLALPCLLYSMDLTVLHLAVPKLSEDLKPSMRSRTRRRDRGSASPVRAGRPWRGERQSAGRGGPMTI